VCVFRSTPSLSSYVEKSAASSFERVGGFLAYMRDMVVTTYLDRCQCELWQSELGGNHVKRHCFRAFLGYWSNRYREEGEPLPLRRLRLGRLWIGGRRTPMSIEAPVQGVSQVTSDSS